jgi:hypothetical protein
VKQRKPTKTWEKTRLQNLVRHKSGRYYARAFAGSKEFWKSLGTSHFSIAQARLAEFLKGHRERHQSAPIRGTISAKMTFGEAAEIHLRDLDDDTEIKESTRHYWRQCLAGLVRTWPGLNETEVRRITRKDCESWARHYRKTASPVRFNNTVAILQHVLRVAVEAGVIYRNPAAKPRGVTPEYNWSVSGVLKNAIDWASRPHGDSAWDGKPAAIMGASTGAIGTARAQNHLRQILVYLNMFPINQPEVLISHAMDRFDQEGNLTDVPTR